MIDSDHFGTPIDTAALSRFLRNAQRQVGVAGEVNVLITSDQEMRRLNREFRRKNKPTDVLSFPSSLNGKSGIAGDIAISAQIARANAEVLGHPLESEIKVLLLHGLLHLAGYDHESDNGKMAKREQQLRTKFELPTGLIARTKKNGNTKTLVVPAAASPQRPQRQRPSGAPSGRAFRMGRENRSSLKRARVFREDSMPGGSNQPAGGGRIHVTKRRSSVTSVSSVVNPRRAMRTP